MLDALAGIRGAYDHEGGRRAWSERSRSTPPAEVRTYSKGNRQKVMLVAAFAARTDLLVLDEPTSGLDPLMEQVFQTCVREAAASGRTVLLSSHILSEVERLCASVTIVREGRLVESGAVAQMRHLASARVTGRVPAIEVGSLRESSARWAGVEGAVDNDGSVDLRVPEADVRTVLAVLLNRGAEAITCTPATLDDLFLRHYAVAPREPAAARAGPTAPCLDRLLAPRRGGTRRRDAAVLRLDVPDGPGTRRSRRPGAA